MILMKDLSVNKRITCLKFNLPRLNSHAELKSGECVDDYYALCSDLGCYLPTEKKNSE